MPDFPGIQKIAGPLLFALLFNWFFLGILSVQVYLYYLSFRNDSAIAKIIVFTLFFIETTQTFLLTCTSFKTFAIGFRNPLVLDQVNISWFSVSVLCGIVASISQSFYARRLFIITKSKILAAIILLLSSVQLGAAIADGIQCKEADLFSQLYTDNQKASFQATSNVWGSCSAACDVLIAIFLSYQLRRHKSSAIKETQKLLSKLIRVSVQTGTFTAVVAIVTIILSDLPDHPTYYQTSLTVLSKTYSTSMLVALNSRTRVFSPSAPVWNEERLSVEDIQVEGESRLGRSSLRFTPIENIDTNEIELNTLTDTFGSMH